MDYLVDTNVLIRLVVASDPLHATARSAIRALERQNGELFATGQNFIELWNVATRPSKRNGFGLEPQAARRMLSKLEASFPRLKESGEVYPHWKDLVVRFEVCGVQVHDARLVAAMLTSGVSKILTFNVRDFRRFTEMGIEAIDPRAITQPQDSEVRPQLPPASHRFTDPPSLFEQRRCGP